MAEEGTWVPEFPGQRPPFAVGNSVALKHGGKSVVALRPRAAELVEHIKDVMPVYTDADGMMVEILGMQLAQAERVNEIIVAADFGKDVAYLVKYWTSLANGAVRTMSALGMSPLARSQLGLNHLKGSAMTLLQERLASESRTP